MDIGDRIKKIRVQKGLSTYKISKMTGISQSVVSRLENKKRKADNAIIEKLAKALEVSPDRLTGESASSIIENRLAELGISLEEVAEKAGVPLAWLEKLDSFIPGDMEFMIAPSEGHPLEWDDTIGGYNSYKLITKVAEVIGLPGSTLRTALARQEIPLPDDLPHITAEEAFKQAQEDFRDPLEEDTIKSIISKPEQEHLRKYRYVDEKGKHTVDTVLEMEYNRCKADNENNVIQLPLKDNSHLEPVAAHDRTDIAPEDRTEEAKQQEEDIVNDENF